MEERARAAEAEVAVSAHEIEERDIIIQKTDVDLELREKDLKQANDRLVGLETVVLDLKAKIEALEVPVAFALSRPKVS